MQINLGKLFQILSEDELKELKSDIETELVKRDAKTDHELYNDAMKTNSRPTKLAAIALLHDKWNIQPKSLCLNEEERKKLGYELADLYKDYYMNPSKDNTILREILKRFDIVSYIYKTTHYEECDNGHFWKRS